MSHKRERENIDSGVDKIDEDDVEPVVEFEDQFSDDYDSEDDVPELVEQVNGEGGEGENEDEEEEEEEKKIWNPSAEPLKPGEKLEYDNSAYDLIHFIGVEWPCLSFDIIPDNLGVQRTNYPHTLYFVAGTQASNDKDNSILLMKLSDLHATKTDEDSNEGFDPDQSDDQQEGDPIIEHRSIPHPLASINRIRVMPQQPNIVASLSNKEVNIFDIKHHLSALDKPPTAKLTEPDLLFSFKGHPTEGWALDWSTKIPGRLLSGDCSSYIYLWDQQGASWNVDKVPFSGHTGSVEDVCWSPTEGDVFSSCSVDGSIRLWDSRKGKTAVASIRAHDTDVNVMSWNHKRAFLILSGADDGCFRIWDLRKLGTETKHQFSFNWHSGPITSVEWSPNDDAEFVVASEDNSITIWDLSLTTEKSKVDGMEIPSQLLFVHQGQEHIKEVHWHKQIPGLLVSTAADGFNVFKPSNISV